MAQSSFLAVDQQKEEALQLADVRLVAADGVLLHLQWWTLGRGTFPSSSAPTVCIRVEGIPLILYDEVGLLPRQLIQSGGNREPTNCADRAPFDGGCLSGPPSQCGGPGGGLFYDRRCAFCGEDVSSDRWQGGSRDPRISYDVVKGGPFSFGAGSGSGGCSVGSLGCFGSIQNLPDSISGFGRLDLCGLPSPAEPSPPPVLLVSAPLQRPSFKVCCQPL